MSVPRSLCLVFKRPSVGRSLIADKIHRRAFISHVEVERKFQPTAILDAVLNDQTQQILRDELKKHAASKGKDVEPPLTFSRLPNTVIRDTYYDLDDQLSSNGIWIKFRSTTEGNDENNMLLTADGSSSEWDAKMSLGSGFIESRFHELQGLTKVCSLLAEHLPDTSIDELERIADLETHRQTWLVHEASTAQPLIRDTLPVMGSKIHIVLDRVTAPVHSAGGLELFSHFIGEIEMTGTVVGGTDGPEQENARREVSEAMRQAVDEFVFRYAALFPTSTELKGKLSAYFDWKKHNMER